MAQAKKKSAAAKMSMAWRPSWKWFLVFSSLTLNIAFAVAFLTLTLTHGLDSVFMREGLSRYCDPINDDKFVDNDSQTLALRRFTCAQGDASSYFKTGLNSYLDAQHIQHN